MMNVIAPPGQPPIWLLIVQESNAILHGELYGYCDPRLIIPGERLTNVLAARAPNSMAYLVGEALVTRMDADGWSKCSVIGRVEGCPNKPSGAERS